MAKKAATFEELAELLAQICVAADLFGDDPLAEYRRLAKLCHPDRFALGPQRDRAQQVFKQLTALFERASAARVSFEIASPLRRYALLEKIASGELADVYLAEADARRFVLKICRVTGGNALLVAEQRLLTKLAQRSGDRHYREYLPIPVDSFIATDDFAGRQVNVFPYRAGFHTLESIRQRFPDGLDPRHLAWLFKRMLAVAGFAHHCGFVHGAVLPPHVLVHPENHGLQFVDWIYAAKLGRRMTFIPTNYSAWYPPEVLSKQPATAATDIFLAAKCLQYAAGGDAITGRWPVTVPAKLQRFVDTCFYPSPLMRPRDAWQLHEEWDELLLRLFGPPKYHRLVMA